MCPRCPLGHRRWFALRIPWASLHLSDQSLPTFCPRLQAVDTPSRYAQPEVARPHGD